MNKINEQIKKDYVKNCTWKRWNKLDPRIKESLKPYTVHRPRPLIFLGWRNGKRVYCKNHSLSYWQLLKKYPPKSFTRQVPRAAHIFAKQHHLTPHRLQRKIGSYLVWGGIIGFLIFSAIIYIAGFIGVLL